jgi:tRNA A-37 threonylcarbamoyl transferase component Bud32
MAAAMLSLGFQMKIQLVPAVGHPNFLDLPWELPLEDWDEATFVSVARGISRHVVRFVEREGATYALKELPQRLAEREYRLLRDLARNGIPVVAAVGVVSDRHDDLDAVLITRHLEFSLPYRHVLRARAGRDLRRALLDAFAELLVRLHLAGFFWGDCSLSNTLFRRDAGALSAYLVDAETGELHPELSDGQRRHDLDIAEENVIGELYDLEAELGEAAAHDPFVVAADIRARYERLWAELTAEELFAPGERHRLEERLRRLNELGFDVDEVEVVATPQGYRLRLRSKVVEQGHHRRRLLRLTGLNAQENQARRLLNDIASYRVEVERRGTTGLTDAAVAGRWLAEVFEPTIASIPPELRAKRAAAEQFHEILEHRWFLSERAGRDVGLDAAVKSYVDSVLREAPDERVVLEP